MIVTRNHPFTGEINSREIAVTHEQLEAWETGMCIQNAMPDVSADDREFIMTGITDWDSLFANEE